MLNALTVAVTVGIGCLLLYPRLAGARLWRATITPLASIIGSGFLVIGPILDASFGALAPLAMAALAVIAWLFGAAIRFNIARLAGPGARRSGAEERLEVFASWTLAFAYVVSVAYYLNLLGSFAVSLTASNDARHARLVATGVFVVILAVGMGRGFGALERLEQVSVGVKLSIIGGLLFALGWFMAERASGSALIVNPPTVGGWQALALTAGLIVTVQGFETSRYLGGEYDAAMRVRSMRLAQGIAAGIYMLYILLLSYVFAPQTVPLSETAIIDMMTIVAPILPVLLIAAAISAQFSAAVADTGGAGGLLSELTGGRISARGGYGILVALGIALTWMASVFEIIGYASRAFAAYYAIQAGIAAFGCRATGRGRLATGYAALAALGAAIAIFGASVEQIGRFRFAIRPAIAAGASG